MTRRQLVNRIILALALLAAGIYILIKTHDK